MLARLTRRITFLHRTREQDSFLNTLPKMKFGSDEELLANIRAIYEKREFLQECQAFSDVTGRIQSYLLRNPKCTVAHLQCYYKLKEMRMVGVPFRHNLHRKYHRFLLTPHNIRNEHLQKYLWFLYDEGAYERELFRQAAELHTLTLFEIYQYMNGLRDLPTWEPYVRITTMLKHLGHSTKTHRALGAQRTIDRLAHKYYPHLARLFSAQEMAGFEKEHKYDTPFLTYLTDEYVVKNVSQYDSYLQRVEFVQLEQQYERILDVMVWTQFPAFLDLAIANYQLNGGNDQIENRVQEIFFRLCEHADIDLETITSILSCFLAHPSFMASRRFPIITRCTDSIFKRGLQDFSYLPAEAFEALLVAASRLSVDSASKEYLQKFICLKVSNKLVWNAGEVEKLRQFAEGRELAGGIELTAYLRELQGKASDA